MVKSLENLKKNIHKSPKMEAANNYIYFWEICFVSLLCIATVDAECNVCQRNHAACINSTHYYLCFGENTPNTDTLYPCMDGFECTDLNAICVQANNARRPSCGDTSLCGLCSAHRNYLFACTSRTTFQMCYGATHPSSQVGYCPEGFVCDADSDTICVNSTQPHEITCDILEAPETTPTSNSQGIATTTETTPATQSPNPMPMTPDQVCAERRRFGLFPIVPSDPNCLRYISCYSSNDLVRGHENSCPSGTYFNINREQCTLQKPSYCP